MYPQYPQEFEDMADNYLSNFTGEDMSGYIGEEMFDGGLSTFDQNMFTGRVFILTITNTATDARSCYVLPGNLYSLGYNSPDPIQNGMVKTGSFLSIEGLNGLAGSTNVSSVEEFFQFVNSNPTQIVGMKVVSNLTVAQQQVTINFTSQSPFGRGEEQPIFLGAAFSDKSFTQLTTPAFRVPTSKISANNQMQAQMQILPAAGGTANVVQIWFFCGVIDNSAVTLTNKAVGNRQVLPQSGGQRYRG